MQYFEKYQIQSPPDSPLVSIEKKRSIWGWIGGLAVAVLLVLALFVLIKMGQSGADGSRDSVVYFPTVDDCKAVNV